MKKVELFNGKRYRLSQHVAYSQKEAEKLAKKAAEEQNVLVEIVPQTVYRFYYRELKK